VYSVPPSREGSFGSEEPLHAKAIGARVVLHLGDAAMNHSYKSAKRPIMSPALCRLAFFQS
jgi:hypothetical protein